MGTVIAFKPKPDAYPRTLNPPSPPWRRALIDLWIDQSNWKTTNRVRSFFTAHCRASVYPIDCDPACEEWSFTLWVAGVGVVDPGLIWDDEVLAENAAWEALVEVMRPKEEAR